MRSLLLLTCLAASPLHALASGAHAGKWEWAGLFQLGAENYTWSCARQSSGAYAESEVQLLIVPADHADAHGLEEAEEDAEAKWGNAAVEVAPGGLVPVGAWAHLELDQESWVTHFRIVGGSAQAYAVFMNHLPTEFENDFHYIKDKQGNDIEPVAEEAGGHHDHADHDDHEERDKWGLVVLGSVLIAAPSVALIACLGPVFHKLQHLPRKEPVFAVLYALASGALFGAAVFLLLGEGLFLASEGKSEAEGVATWGVAILAGWLLCVAIHQAADLFSPFPGEAEEPGASAEVSPYPGPAEERGASAEAAGDKLSKVKPVDIAVATPVFLGDFWHNLVDGMVLGLSAKSCDTSVTWTIVVVTILHEVPQEIADFIVLVTKANLKWYWATVLNFASGASVLLGAVFAYGTEISSNVQGVGLAFGAGVYLYVAMTELAPSILAKGSATDYMLRMFAFVLGATAIGLVLIGHEHCGHNHGASEVEGDSHAGHGH